MITNDNNARINNTPTCTYNLLFLLQSIKIVSYSLLPTIMVHSFCDYTI